MDKKYITKTIPAILLSISMVLCQGLIKTSHASAKITPVILLSDYQKEMKIGEEYSLFAYSSDGRIPKFSSSDKKIATVDQYGKIIAKKSRQMHYYSKSIYHWSILQAWSFKNADYP